MTDFPRKEANELDSTSELIFQITDWYIQESDKGRERSDEPENYSITIYGTTGNGETVCVNVVGYEPFFYVKPPDSWDKYSDQQFKSEVLNLRENMETERYECIFKQNGRESKYNKRIISNPYLSHLKDVSMVKKKEFWGFTNNTDFRFIKISVLSLALYNNLKYYFQSLTKKGFKLYESNIDPFLRYIHSQNIKPCGWVSIKDYQINEDNNTRCDYNVETNYANINPVEINNIAPLLIASFDIECTSSHGDFPVAIKDYRKVAQDLANVAKEGYEITQEFLLYWLETIYTKDAIIDGNLKIHQVYPKCKVVFEKYRKQIIEKSNDIIAILNKISDISVDESSDDEDTNVIIDEVATQPVSKGITRKDQIIEELKLNDILCGILPAIKGDKIIQIGTTVHRYGSDEIIYKNIISLNDCDDIEDTDVVSCKTEKQVLLEWKKLIGALNPDILIGYNIFGFDMEYMYNRVIENNIYDEFTTGLGRKFTRKSNLVKQSLSSSALGDNTLKYFDIDGTVVIDLYKVMQREQKLDSYKLDSVAQIFLGDKKDDLKPHEIFAKFLGTSEDRCTIAKYCVQDCVLVNRLLHKLKILENNIGMGNVCLVPLNYLFRRGQGIKIFSLIAKECMDRNHLIPVIRSFNDCEAEKDGYEGAVVLEPKEGIYLDDPIVVFDYGSLYPSSMIARNLSHDCYVMNDKYKVEDPNIEYKVVSYDIYEGVGDKKKKVDVKNCTFAQYKDGKKGIIVDILCLLLQQRKNTRKKMEYQTIELNNNESYSGVLTDKDDSWEIFNIDTNSNVVVKKCDVINIKDTFNNFEKDVFDALQLAYKVTANSLYGQIGAKTSPIYLKEIAACTTATGREMIMLAKEYVETKYNAEVIYGDSVMPYTPITYKTDDRIIVSTFESVDAVWFPYKNFKPNDADRYDKEQSVPVNMYIWTHNGWSKIKRLIRHKTVKKIYRITTSTAIVDVTEDHSLLDANVQIIKPTDCKIGQKLLHSRPEFKYYNRFIDEKQAYLYGHFVATGSCMIYNVENKKKITWELHNNSLDILTKCKQYLEEIEKLVFKITKRHNVYILRVDENDEIETYDFVSKYRFHCYHGTKKFIPNIILNSTEEILCACKSGIDDGCNKYIFNINHQITIQSHVVLLQMLNYTVSISTQGNYAEILLNLRNNSIDQIIDITKLHHNYDGYVYDIETESGVFHGGIGNMILKNTDSIFCKFPLVDKDGNKVNGKDSLKYAIEIGKHVEKNIVSIMPKPQKLNYEKSLYPFILFSKKKYVGNLYENDDKHFKQKSMGIVLKRRDNALIVKKIFGGIIDILLNQHDLGASIQYLSTELTKLVKGETPISDLVITKKLSASYKDASKIPHKVLADRIGERDPGNKPQVNDRVPFVYIKIPEGPDGAVVGLQGDRIECPEYIMANNLTPDYLHYITNQIMNPVMQLYALCLKNLPKYDKPPGYWLDVENELKKKPLYIDDVKRKHRLDNLKLKTVQELLFQEFIDMLSAPKIKKVRKQTTKGTIIVGDNIKDAVDVVKKVKKTKEKKDDVQTSQAVQASLSVKTEMDLQNTLEADIKVIQKKDTKIIEAKAQISKDKKVIWKYVNDKGVSKKNEIMSIIIDMVNHSNGVKLNIKINYKQFKTDYYKALVIYKDMEKSDMNDVNVVQKAINDNDVGVMKDVNIVMAFQKLIEINDSFVIV